jgi:hypothetical protein
MAKYKWTQHTPGHIAIPVIEKGKVKMNVPDAADVKAATEANAQHDTMMRKALKQTMKAQNKTKGITLPEVILDAQVAAARIAPKMRVPLETPVVNDTMLVFEHEYDLPADDDQVKNYVALGHLQAVEVAVAPVTTTETK